jgi:GT2 family glycosyltransferase
MIRLLEVDLLDPAHRNVAVDGPVWVLVRYGPEVLGEVRLRSMDTIAARRLHDDLLHLFEPMLAARRSVAVAESIARLAPPSISVVVCTRDRTENLRRCLDHLLRLDPAPREILVVDNAPTNDLTARLCETRGVNRVVESRPGLDHARNLGWRTATSDVVAFIDDDADADRHFTANLTRAFTCPGVAAVSGLVLAAELETYSQVYFERTLGGMRKGFARRVFHRDGDYVGLEAFRLGVGTNMAYRRAVLDDLGGFDPRLDVGTQTRGGGDLDMFFRVVEAGYVLVYEPDVVVRHRHRVTRAQLRAQSRDNGVAFAAYLAVRAEAGEAAAQSTRRYRRRWLRRRTVDIARAMRARDLLGLQVTLAELFASRLGAAALAYETERQMNEANVLTPIAAMAS